MRRTWPGQLLRLALSHLLAALLGLGGGALYWLFVSQPKLQEIVAFCARRPWSAAASLSFNLGPVDDTRLVLDDARRVAPVPGLELFQALVVEAQRAAIDGALEEPGGKRWASAIAACKANFGPTCTRETVKKQIAYNFAQRHRWLGTLDLSPRGDAVVSR